MTDDERRALIEWHRNEADVYRKQADNCHPNFASNARSYVAHHLEQARKLETEAPAADA